jgi:uncharacterized delta-60 repeat protein
MRLTLRRDKTEPLTIQEMDENLLFIESKGVVDITQDGKKIEVERANGDKLTAIVDNNLPIVTKKVLGIDENENEFIQYKGFMEYSFEEPSIFIPLIYNETLTTTSNIPAEYGKSYNFSGDIVYCIGEICETFSFDGNMISNENYNGVLESIFGNGFNNTVQTIQIQSDGKILLGGAFTTYQGVGANYIIRLNSDGTRDNSFNIVNGFNNTVQTIQIQPDGKILLGGAFTTYQGVGANYIIRLNSDGTRDNSFNIVNGFNNTVQTIQIQSDGKILVGGGFTSYQGVGANYIIRLNSDGTRDNTFNIGNGFNNTVQTIQIQSDGKILVGGVFTSYGGVAANRIIRLNSDGTRDNTFNIGTGFGGTVFSIQIQPDGKILLGGGFTSYQGVTANRIIRLNSDGTRDNTFDIGTGFGGTVFSIQIQPDGKILIGGAFTTYGGVSANRMVRLNSDGTRDNTFNIGTGFGGTVNTIQIQSDGKILVGGAFTTYGGVTTIRIIRLNSDGTRDNTFDIGTGFESTVQTIQIQPDGEILVGGFFTSYQGVTANRMVRLNSDGSIDNTFITKDNKFILQTSDVNFNIVDSNGEVNIRLNKKSDRGYIRYNLVENTFKK